MYNCFSDYFRVNKKHAIRRMSLFRTLNQEMLWGCVRNTRYVDITKFKKWGF